MSIQCFLYVHVLRAEHLQLDNLSDWSYIEENSPPPKKNFCSSPKDRTLWTVPKHIGMSIYMVTNQLLF